MGTKLTVEYDEVGDILYLDIAEPELEQVMHEVAPGMLLRRNQRTRQFDGIEIHGLRKRGAHAGGITMPVKIILDALPNVAS